MKNATAVRRAHTKGPPNLLQVTGLSEDEFRALARTTHSRDLAKKLGFSARCVQQWMRQLGVAHLPNRPKRQPTDLSEVHDYGPIAQWIRDNPAKKLPKTRAEIAALVGVSENTVHCWLRRRRLRYRRYVESLGDLRLVPGASVLAEGRGLAALRVPVRLIKAYRLDVNPRTLEVSIFFRVGVERADRQARMALRAYYDLFH